MNYVWGMGTIIGHIKCTFNFNDQKPGNFNIVSAMAIEVISETLTSYKAQKLKTLIAVTSCPDQAAPSLGQTILDACKELPRDVQVIDIVQGCSGGANGLILAAQLSTSFQQDVLVVASDAALNGVDRSNPLSRIFSNGSFSCIVAPNDSDAGLLFKDHFYFEGLYDVVNIPIGQNTAPLCYGANGIGENPWNLLQIRVNRRKTVAFMQHADAYIQRIVGLSPVKPQFAIMHQANPAIQKWLAKTFRKHNIQCIDMSGEIGNCGAASIGVVLQKKFVELQGKTVLLGSFGTGGGINVGIWKL